MPYETRGRPHRETGFPATVVTILAVAAVIVGALSWYHYTRRKEREAFEARRLDEARAVLEEAQAASKRKNADEARAQRHAERVARSFERLQSSTSPTTLCDAALDLAHARAREAIPELLGLLQRRTENLSVRNCAAGALVELGQTAEPLDFYLECSRAWTSDCRRIAIGGFGDIGPPAAEVSLPYFRQALQSSDGTLRYVAVDALAKLGPLAEPLLREAAQDTDESVRQRAAQALKDLSF